MPLKNLEIEILRTEIPVKNAEGKVVEIRRQETTRAIKAPIMIQAIEAISAEEYERAIERRAPKAFRNIVRTNHHRAAQLVAQGWPLNQVAAQIGMHYTTIKLLLRSPQFTELVEYYRSQYDPGPEAHERMQALVFDGLDRIQQKLLEDENLSMDDIRKVTMDLIESTGLKAPSRSEVLTRNMHLSGKLDSIKQETPTSGKVIDRSTLAKELSSRQASELARLDAARQQDPLLGPEGPAEERSQEVGASVRGEGETRALPAPSPGNSDGEPVD